MAAKDELTVDANWVMCKDPEAVRAFRALVELVDLPDEVLMALEVAEAAIDNAAGARIEYNEALEYNTKLARNSTILELATADQINSEGREHEEWVPTRPRDVEGLNRKRETFAQAMQVAISNLYRAIDLSTANGLLLEAYELYKVVITDDTTVREQREMEATGAEARSVLLTAQKYLARGKFSVPLGDQKAVAELTEVVDLQKFMYDRITRVGDERRAAEASRPKSRLDHELSKSQEKNRVANPALHRADIAGRSERVAREKLAGSNALQGLN